MTKNRVVRHRQPQDPGIQQEPKLIDDIREIISGFSSIFLNIKIKRYNCKIYELLAVIRKNMKPCLLRLLGQTHAA